MRRQVPASDRTRRQSFTGTARAAVSRLRRCDRAVTLPRDSQKFRSLAMKSVADPARRTRATRATTGGTRLMIDADVLPRIRPATLDDADEIARLAGELGYPAATTDMHARLSLLLPRA